MLELSYGELILLSNLIYLDLKTEENYSLEEITNNILINENFDELMNNVGNCIMKMSNYQWINILSQIKNSNSLKKLKIKNINDYKNGRKFACFVGEKNTAIVVFRGTSTESEWQDNGEGSYEDETKEQQEALNFINNLNYDNIIVTGHSKGGNKAQYVTVLSSKISRCISINSQGFSNEFMEKYSKEIDKNSFKIICINAEYDYVSCLFNSISGKTYYIKTDFQVNPFYYHKADILLDENGYLRAEVNKSILSDIINEFSLYVISDLPKAVEKIIINLTIDFVELILCKKNIFKFSGEFLKTHFYEKILYYEENFLNYAIVELLILPLLFWRELLELQETKSNELRYYLVKNINSFGKEIIRKFDAANEGEELIVDNLLGSLNILTNRLENEFKDNK